MWPAFYNGYPLVTSDSGAYVRFAYDFQVQKDRSAFYSVFVALSGARWLLHTGWLPVIIQAFVLSVLLWRFFKLIGPGSTYGVIFILMLGTAFFTGAAWTASYIMPDVFTPILFLSTVLYIYDTSLKRAGRILYLAVVSIALLIHNSHLIILPLFLLLLFVVSLLSWKNLLHVRRLLPLSGVTVSCFLLVCSLNYSKGMGFTVSPSTHVFLAGKLVETGIMKTYLAENCSNSEYKLCAYVDELPEHAYQYIWYDEGPFHKIGGWDSSRQEHEQILHNVLTTPRYAKMFLFISGSHTLQQLLNINISYTAPLAEGSSPYNNISNYLPSDMNFYNNAKQQFRDLDDTVSFFRHFHKWIFVLTTVWILLLLIQGKPMFNDSISAIYMVILLYVLCNAFVTATFANVLERLQNRVFWLIPATNLYIIIGYYYKQVKQRQG